MRRVLAVASGRNRKRSPGGLQITLEADCSCELLVFCSGGGERLAGRKLRRRPLQVTMNVAAQFAGATLLQ
eukprot:15462287-Alexandrium_andersonii.AAC.1